MDTNAQFYIEVSECGCELYLYASVCVCTLVYNCQSHLKVIKHNLYKLITNDYEKNKEEKRKRSKGESYYMWISLN